jgi:PAT family beta-lactamase induction signal transducer AmpG
MAKEKRSGWWWIPSLYYAEGIPYIVVMTVSVVMYKKMGISNTDIALYTSWLYLPWVIKPFWSPLVDMLRTKRFWIVIMQLFIGAGLGGVALTIQMPDFFRYTLLFFWLLAFSSATHDIAADGFYMLGLSQHDQAWFVGVRSTFYRLAMITGQGLLIYLAGYIESQSGLDSIETMVIANPTSQESGYIHPDSLQIITDDDAIRIISHPDTIDISTSLRSKSEINSVINFVINWNENTGHVKGESRINQLVIKQEEKSWWQEVVVQNFEDFIRKHFGETQIQPSEHQHGNFGIVYFYLSKKPAPGQEIVVNFGRDSGDKSISLYKDPDNKDLATGSRLLFNENNWNIPAMAVIQLDPKLKYATNAVFISQSGNIPLSWMLTFFCMTGVFLLFFVYHKFILPFPNSDRPALSEKTKNYLKEFVDTFVLFFKKDKIFSILAFLLFFRLAEAQIVKLASPFLLDTQEMGGLALTTQEYGLAYGIIGIISLTFGGLLGGFLAAKHGLKYWLWPMAIAINLPDLVYVYLSYAIPDSYLIINICVAIEQFGYGFGFTAYMLYMIFVAEGDHKTAHFAIATGFMALGMMFPGMISGYIQELIGYQHFFIWVMIATIPSFLVLKFIYIDPDFGKKDRKE